MRNRTGVPFRTTHGNSEISGLLKIHHCLLLNDWGFKRFGHVWTMSNKATHLQETPRSERICCRCVTHTERKNNNIATLEPLAMAMPQT